MRIVDLSTTGVKVSELCLGTMMFADRCDYTASEEIVNAALDRGVTFIDTAAAYSAGVCEEYLGKILKGKRDKVFLLDTPQRFPRGIEITLTVSHGNVQTTDPASEDRGRALLHLAVDPAALVTGGAVALQRHFGAA